MGTVVIVKAAVAIVEIDHREFRRKMVREVNEC